MLSSYNICYHILVDMIRSSSASIIHYLYLKYLYLNIILLFILLIYSVSLEYLCL